MQIKNIFLLLFLDAFAGEWGHVFSEFPHKWTGAIGQKGKAVGLVREPPHSGERPSCFY